MDYEKKLEEAKKLYKTANANQRYVLESLFPELRESEDKRIKNALIRFHKSTIDVDGIKGEDVIAWLEKQGNEPNWCHHKVDLSDCSEEYRRAYYDGWNNCNMQHSQCNAERNDVVKCLINGMKFYYEDNKEAMWGTEKFSMKVKDILNWLEKQGEQKPADKVEPKFHEGEWITCEELNTAKIINLDGNRYVAEFIDGNKCFPRIDFVDRLFHLWTIQDAKEGNILAGKIDGDNYILIFKTIKDGWIETYGHYYNAVDRFCVPSQLFCRSYQGTFTPATKEQRDLLFTKMEEAGYTFNFEKKELKKIEDEEYNGEDYGIDSLFHAQRILEKTLGEVEGYQTDDGILSHKCAISAVKKLYEQKPAEWSEEDESYLNTTIAYLKDAKEFKKNAENCINWLKSLKQRIGG